MVNPHHIPYKPRARWSVHHSYFFWTTLFFRCVQNWLIIL